MLKCLAYTSRARLDLTAGDLADIHVTSRHLNALDGVTGLLVFDGVRFLQVLEGVEEGIDSLMARLYRDQRHSAIEVRDQRMIEARSFPDWTMELLRVSAGYQQARSEIASILPADTAPAVRDIAMRMAAELSGDG